LAFSSSSRPVLGFVAALDKPAAEPESTGFTMVPSLVEQGFYYEKANSRGWLRYVVTVHDCEARYVDFTGVGICDTSTLASWASWRLTAAAATAQFPEEVARIKLPF
jgi:hypothetical protein